MGDGIGRIRRVKCGFPPVPVLLFFFWIWILGMVTTSTQALNEPVSFFGSSHITVRLQEARSSSDIFFRIRTKRTDAMLFLAAGRTDYCLLVLDAGRLKVHINLGAGETEVDSEAPFLLNDMKWHSVNLTRRGSQLSLLVDNHLTKKTLPNRFHELNIHFGIWVGGLAGFNEIFLGNLPAFRGCFSDLSYNSEDIMAKARTHLGQMTGVTIGCSEEFDATSQDPFTLSSPQSFAMLRNPISRQGTTIRMNLKPFANDSDGLVLYVAGVSSRPDYLALELKQGKIRSVADMGNGAVQVQSTFNVTDNQWHSVVIQVTPNSLSMRVDNHTWTSDPGRGGNRHLDVSEVLYIGFDETRRNKIRGQALIDRSFLGCVKDLLIGEKPMGLPEVDVTSNITKGCITCDTCVSSVGEGMKEHSTKPNASSSSHEVVTISREMIRIVAQTDIGELEIIKVIPVHVAEGDSAIITPRHLQVTMDLSKFGIRESGVLFRIVKNPQYGRIEVTSRTAGSSSGRSTETFSLLDVGAGRVRFYHSSVESQADEVKLALRLIPATEFLLPSYLKDDHPFSLPIEITAVNDPPEIRLRGVLRLAEGTKIRLTPDVITALDPDTGPQDLYFSIMSQGIGGEKRGYIELETEPGKAVPIRNFTQQDLQASKIWYVDQGQTSSKIAFKVSDGSSISQPGVLRVETFPLRVAPETNTGLEVANIMGAAVLITAGNLSFTSNAGDQGLVVEYHVTSGPKSGMIQLQRTNGQWTTTDQFTQLDLQSTRIRYLLQRPSDVATEDEFTFHVSLAETKVPTEFRFRIRILSLQISSVASNVLSLNETTQAPLFMRYKTTPLVIPDKSVIFFVVQPPRRGYLALSSSYPSQKPISSFTQADLAEGKVIYSFNLVPFSPISDHFLFNVTTAHLDVTLSGGPFRYDIHHITKRKPGGVTVKPLIVIEGGREALTSKTLKIRITGEREGYPVFFNVTSGPNFGRLEKERDTLRSASLVTAPTYQPVDQFSSQDLDRGRIWYVNDGSEMPRDTIALLAWNEEGMFAFQLDIVVKGVNNHPPKKAETASFSINCVIGGKRRLTPLILDYQDEDWDAERSALKYTTKGNPTGGVNGRESIGNLYDQSISTSTPIFQWTQSDVDAGNLIFQHEGVATHGILVFWVTDGKFVVNGTIRITAGQPWTRVTNTSNLVVRKGSAAKLDMNSITVDTNLDVDLSQIILRIVDGPHHGAMRVNGSRAGEFSMSELASGGVDYQSLGTTEDVGRESRDGFTFEGWVGNQAKSELHQFDISIFPEAYWVQLKVETNKSVTVNENGSVVISQTYLHIINQHIPPSDIVYTLTRPPSHGYLAIDPNHSNENSDDYVTMWDQTVINDGRLRYVQSEPNKTRDFCEFIVTNGVQTMRNLKLDFIVIPSSLILASSPVVINEGSSAVLNFTHLRSAQNFFADKLTEVKVVSPPKHGRLGLLPNPDAEVKIFPYKALQEGKVVITHDGSETMEDKFTVVGVAVIHDDMKGEKRILSQPHSVQVQIVSTNDQVPQIQNNTGAWVWMGGTTVISNRHLAAADADSDRTLLVYYIVGNWGGYPALANRSEEPLTNFTQTQINQSLITFVHQGEDLKQCGFEFEVSDGLNEADKAAFLVKVRKPVLTIQRSRTPLSVFPFTQTPLTLENILVNSSDGREVHFQVTGAPALGRVVMQTGENHFIPATIFTQSNLTDGKIYYEHLKSLPSQTVSKDVISLVATAKYAEPLTNLEVDVEISVNGAALAALKRYVVVNPVTVQEGGKADITPYNINFSAVAEFIRLQHRGNMWKHGLPSLRLQTSEVPKHGYLEESNDVRLRPGHNILPSLLTSSGYLQYIHDDSEFYTDMLGFSLWLVTSNASMEDSTLNESSTFLLNFTLPVIVTPVNDQRPSLVPSKSPIAPVVQGHWRGITREDLQVADPDTPSVHIEYTVLKVSHGRIILLPSETKNLGPRSGNNNGESGFSFRDVDIKDFPDAQTFSQADIDGERVIFHHSGPATPVILNLEFTDGKHTELTTLQIPVQPLILQALQGPPIRILQGRNAQNLDKSNVPVHTNGNSVKLTYVLTRPPLHGKLVVNGRAGSLSPTLTFQQLVQGDVSYVQTDMSVTNDSFEISASFNDPEIKRVQTAWLVNVVAIPLLKRVQETHSFVRGLAVGGIIAPDIADFSVSHESRSTITLGLMDASPLAALTGANPQYEILVPPKSGQLYKIPFQQSKDNLIRYKRSLPGRRAGRFSHEDVRRGLVVYIPDSVKTDSYAAKYGLQSDEFMFKVLAPGVQPAIAIAKFAINNGLYDPEKGYTEIITDGSTDPATKRGGGSFRDITSLVSPHISRDGLIMIGLIISGVMTLSLFLVIGIRCTCSKKKKRHDQLINRNAQGKNGNFNGDSNKGTRVGIIDAYSTTNSNMIDPSDGSNSDAGLRPLMMSTLSPRNSRTKVSRIGTACSESGSWASSITRNETPTPTPSLPQCRVTPLCTDSGTGVLHHNGHLLYPTPICDTFSVLPEEIDPPEPYGFSYGNIPPPLDIPELDETEATTNFNILTHSNSATMSRATMTLPHPHTPTGKPGTPTGTLPPPNHGGTLRKLPSGKNQYWV